MKKCPECESEIDETSQVCDKCGCVIFEEAIVVDEVPSSVKMFIDKFSIFDKYYTKKNVTIIFAILLVILITACMLIISVNNRKDVLVVINSNMSIDEVEGVVGYEGTKGVELPTKDMVLSYKDVKVNGVTGSISYHFDSENNKLKEARFIFSYDKNDIEKIKDYIDSEFGKGTEYSGEYSFKDDELEYKFTNGSTVLSQTLNVYYK